MRMWLGWLLAGWMSFGVAAGAQDYGDTPYVPTPQVVVDRMLETAKVTKRDFVIDLGSGDGRMIITAAQRFGARGFGVDLNRNLVQTANRNAAKAGVANRAVFYEQDLHETDLSKADVLSLYLLPEVNLMIRSRILALRPGTRLVSHDYGFGEWPPDIEFIMDAPGKKVGRDEKSKVLFYVVPAQVAGKWVWSAPGGTYDLELDQVFQKISGTLGVNGRRANIDKAQLSGEQIRFEAVVGETRYEFIGKVTNNAINGEMRVAGAAHAWDATRTMLREARFHDLKPGVMAR
ncbi:MAG: methyltransferase domain-containing protein [Betaproteobacteria bacterium]|nr:methyltransferase domain-containing protein [Betaproteobacteria bacterium]